MARLGVRCSPDKFAYVLVKGSRSEPELLAADTASMPRDVSRACQLNWVRKEITDLVSKHEVRVCRLKAIEPLARKTMSLLHRAEVEGVVQSALYAAGCHQIECLTKTQVKARLGFSGPAGEVHSLLSTGPFAQLHGTDLEDAALAAWCALEDD